MQGSIRKSDGCDTLQLPPPAASIGLAKERPHLNALRNCNGLNLFDRADDIECHLRILAENAGRKQGQHRGRTASYPNRPRTDPGVPYWSTGPPEVLVSVSGVFASRELCLSKSPAYETWRIKS